MEATWPPQLNTAPPCSTLLVLLADTGAWPAQFHAVPEHHLEAHSTDLCNMRFSRHANDARAAMHTSGARMGCCIL